MVRSSLLSAIILGGCLIAACGGSGDPAQAPAATPAAAQPQPTPATAAIGAAKALNVGDLFPPGAGRDQVMDTCGTCHPVACSARGQRTADQWDHIRETHKDRLTAVSAENLNTLYAYLKANFNDTKPEPQIPAEFIQQGCTPFLNHKDRNDRQDHKDHEGHEEVRR
jgi:hypothetical protein